MTKQLAEKKALGIAHACRRLSDSSHTSRKDNNALFELAYYFEALAERIRAEYADTNYRTPYDRSQKSEGT